MLGSAPGSPLNLECIVEAYPKPIIIWSFGGETFTCTLSAHRLQIYKYAQIAKAFKVLNLHFDFLQIKYFMMMTRATPSQSCLSLSTEYHQN